MSQLPPPNFGNFPPSFNANGFPSCPTLAQGASFSIFSRPPFPPPSFSPRLPFNSFPGPPFCQFRPSVWPNGNCLSNHVAHRHQHPPSPLQRPPHAQVPNFQGKTSRAHEKGQNSVETEFSCDACQKQFTSKETLTAHLGTHIQCNHEDCTFKATRKMLKLHWIQVHAPGKMRIKLDTPEDIAKWREERKRKYPTLANVEKKKEEEAKRRASGQVLKTKNFRYHRGRQHGRRSSQQGGRNHFNNQGHHGRGKEDVNNKEMSKNQTQNSEVAESKDSEGHNRLQNGSDPLSFVLANSHDEEESDSETGNQDKRKCPSTTQETTPNKAPVQVSALNSLCSAYASDSDDNEEISATEINNNKETNCTNYENILEKSWSDEVNSRQNIDSTNETRRDTNNKKNSKSRRGHRGKRKTSSKVDPKSLSVRKSTLLEKLLAPEIRHERNVILQCLRHIVKKNFFGAGDTMSATD